MYKRQLKYQRSHIIRVQKEIIYIPIPAKIVSEALRVFFSQINFLLKKEIDLIEIFYYAAYIHLVFVTIHPFEDGNGRLSRILTTLLLMQAGYVYVPYSSLESVIEQNKQAYYTIT